MFCDNCESDLPDSSFINNQKFCFHCVYRIKLEKEGSKRISKHMHCRTCKKAFAHKEDLKKRQRTVFCSPECAQKGHRNQLDNHWTRKIRWDTSNINKRKQHIWNIIQKSTPREKQQEKYTETHRLTENEES